VSGEDELGADQLAAAFAQLVPHNRALGLELVAYERAGTATMRLPYRAELVGNPDTGVLHGGAVSALLDACSGAAVFIRRWDPGPIATLDIRIDYLKPATPKRDVIAKADCYKVTRNVAFVRAIAHQGDERDPIATSQGTFMLGTRGQFARMGT